MITSTISIAATTTIEKDIRAVIGNAEVEVDFEDLEVDTRAPDDIIIRKAGFGRRYITYIRKKDASPLTT